MFGKEFVDSIVALAPPTEFKIGDKTFSSNPLTEIQPQPPFLPAKIEVCTLLGFADLVRNKLESLDVAKWLILVQAFNKVALVSLTTDEWGRRSRLIEASPVPFESFPFGSFQAQENFIIWVASRFADTPDKQYVLATASSLTNEAVNLSEDDGFTQKATVKAGMKTAATVTLKGAVDLAPFRTFPDIGQPVSRFVFRAKSGDSGPALMLVEADGGKWKLDAMQGIKAYLDSLKLGLPVIA
jgi:hypothetical protein